MMISISINLLYVSGSPVSFKYQYDHSSMVMTRNFCNAQDLEFEFFT